MANLRSCALLLGVVVVGCSSTAGGGASSSTSTSTTGSGSTSGSRSSGSTGSGSSTSGSTGSSGTTGVPSQVAGIIVMRGLGEGTAFKVEYYRQPQANFAPRTVGDGHCDLVAVPGEGDDLWGSLPIGDVDLGDSVTATATNLSLVAARPANGVEEYQAGIAGTYVFNETVTLTNSGADGGWPAGTLATMAIPGQVFPIPSEVETSPGPLVVTWSGGEGAEFFHVRIETSTDRIDCYPPASATSFTLPPDVMARLPARVTPLVSAERIQYLDTDGGPVVVRISSDNLD